VWTLVTMAGQPGLPEMAPTVLSGHTGPVSSVAFNADGRLLVSGGADQIVKVWDLQSRQEEHSFRGHKNWISSVAFSGNGAYVVSASVDKTVKLWELVGREGTPGYGHTREILAVAVSPDGQLMASGSADRAIRLWEMATGKELFTLTGHMDQVTALAFTPDSKTLVSASDDRQLKIWNTETGKEIRTIRDKSPTNSVPVLTVSPDGKQILVWVFSTVLETYDLATGAQVISWSGHDRTLTALAFSADGELAAMGVEDGTVRIWQVAKRERQGSDFPAHQEKIIDLVFTPDKTKLITGDATGQVKIWDLAKAQKAKAANQQPEPERTLSAHKNGVIGVAMSADGKHFATGGKDNVVRVWDTATGQEVRAWDFHIPPLPKGAFLKALVFTPDSKHVVTANANTTLYLLDLP
jgi:WD40 repeat protein